MTDSDRDNLAECLRACLAYRNKAVLLADQHELIATELRKSAKYMNQTLGKIKRRLKTQDEKA